MQDKYAGDVGDFGKFVLLRQLNRESSRQLRLGINWYRTTRHEQGSNDGRHIAYLSSGVNFCNCDPDLFAKLQNIVNNERSVDALERSAILPNESLTFAKPVPYGSTAHSQRIADREWWFEESCRKLRSADLLFLDPDNGIQTPKVTKAQTRSVKYVFLDELRRYFELSDLVIVYNHQDRSPSNRRSERFTAVKEQLGRSTRLRVLRFKRVSVRYYVFLYRPTYDSVVGKLFKTLAAAPYDFLFEEFKLS